MKLRDIIRETQAYYCLDCGKCTAVCPVAAHSETFSPRLTVLHALLGHNGGRPAGRLLGDCLTCGLCTEVCPSAVRYLSFTQMLRREMAETGSPPACSHGGVLTSLMRLQARKLEGRRGHDWVPAEARWAETGPLLYFTGCLPYYEVCFAELGASPLQTARDVLAVLNGLGATPVLLDDELCCGHDLYWNGDEDDARRLAERGAAAIAAAGAETVVSACPECVHALRDLWPALGVATGFRALHLSEYLAERGAAGELGLAVLPGRATYHDSCRLARQLGVVEAPRASLRTIYGSGFREMERHGREAVCCGTSGWLQCDAVSRRLQAERLREAAATGAATLVTACPKCRIHFLCAQGGESDDEVKGLRIRDYASVVREAMEGGEAFGDTA
ncbi:MAG: (Fe-S)-binding protein [Candidatus Krumholzibacteriota bacterium]|nr:(Fe-S)-binding protein [Candidatus Krumholzibacteriota bacterium]